LATISQKDFYAFIIQRFEFVRNGSGVMKHCCTQSSQS